MDFIGTGNRILTENFSIGYLYTITFKTGIHIDSACIGKGADFVMFQRTEPELLFTLNMSTADDVDNIEPYEGGTDDYDELENRPQINSHTLTGNMSGSDLGLQDTISDLDTIRAGATAGATAVQPAALSDYQPLISDLDTIRAGAAAGATAVQPAALSDYQTKIDSSHMLSADLVDDTSATHKFATAAELQQIQTNKNNISMFHKANGTEIFYQESAPTGDILQGSYWISTDGIKIHSRSEHQLFNQYDFIDGGAFYPNSSAQKMVSSNNTAILLIPCEPSTTYTISRANAITQRFNLCFLTTDQIYVDMPVYGIVGSNNALTATSTSDVDSAYMCIYYAKTGGSESSTAEQIQAQLAELMVNEGDTALPHESYLIWT